MECPIFIEVKEYNMTVDTCGFCGFNITTNNDRFAKKVRTTEGEMWKCGNCIKKDFQDSILKQAPGSPAARNIIVKRRRAIEEQRKRINGLMKFHNLHSV